MEKDIDCFIFKTFIMSSFIIQVWAKICRTAGVSLNEGAARQEQQMYSPIAELIDDLPSSLS